MADDKSVAYLRLMVALLATVVVQLTAAAQGRKDSISVDDPRPLAEVVRALETRHGVVITYEDPPYVNAGQIEDVTVKVRGLQRPNGPRVLVPVGGPFEFKYSLEGDRIRPMLEQLVAQYNTTGYPGRFIVKQSESIYHVVPVEFRNKIGHDESHQSILDTRISIEPANTRSALGAVREIAAALTQKAGVRVVVGTLPLPTLVNAQATSAARDEPARSVLLRVLATTGFPMSWQILFAPDLPSTCTLNFHWVPPVKQAR